MQNRAITIHSSITIPMWSPLLVFIICSLTWHSSIPGCWEGIHVLKPAQARCSLWNCFISCSGLILCVGLRHVFAPLCATLTQLDIYALLIKLREKYLHHQLILSAVMQSVDPLNRHNCLSQTEATLRTPLCWEKVSFLCNSCGQAHPPLLPGLHGHIVLAHLLWAFHCGGLSVSHTNASFVYQI